MSKKKTTRTDNLISFLRDIYFHMNEVFMEYEQFTVLPSPDAPPGSGIVALVADGAFLSGHTTYTEAFEAAITLVNNPDTANKATPDVSPPEKPTKYNPVRIRFVADGAKVAEAVLLCESELTREWSKFAADSHDWFGSAANEIADLCGYTAWRFGPDHGTIKLVGFEPGAGGFERPDPNEWYMWDSVNVASEDDINQYMTDLHAIIEQAKSLGWDY